MQRSTNSLSEKSHKTDPSCANDDTGKVNNQEAIENNEKKTISKDSSSSSLSFSPSMPQKLETLVRNLSEFSNSPRQNPRRMISKSAASSRSDSLDSTSSSHNKPHTGGDVRWDAINIVSKGSNCSLNFSHFRLVKRVGYGDIGSVYLVELKGTGTFYAMKVMDKASLASRNKLLRAQTEREILGLLDHPFLPTLYSYFENEKYYSLVMEFCSCGSLHSLRLKQPNRHFTEEAARLVTSCFHFILCTLMNTSNKRKTCLCLCLISISK